MNKALKSKIKSYVFIWDYKDEVPWLELVSFQKQFPGLDLYECEWYKEATFIVVCFAKSKKDAALQFEKDMNDPDFECSINDVKKIEYRKFL